MQNTAEFKRRNRCILAAGTAGVATNILLSAGKAAVGLMAGSIVIVVDAVNNLTDAMSSLVTIIGVRIAEKPADKEHPLGHGRSEYLASLAITSLILYAGISALVETIKRVITPTAPEYSAATLAVVSSAVLVKVILGLATLRTGRRVASDALMNSGRDALFDALIALGTLAAALTYIFFRLNFESYLSLAISIYIIKSGFDMMMETLSQILGRRVPRSISMGIKKTVASFDEVQGAYDLILHNYGPNHFIGSVQVEVPAEMTALEIDALTRRIQHAVMEKYGILLAGIGIYAVDSKNPRAAELRESVSKIVMQQDYVIQVHGIYVNVGAKKICFDIVIDFDAPDRNAVLAAVNSAVSRACPEFDIDITVDTDVSD